VGFRGTVPVNTPSTTDSIARPAENNIMKVLYFIQTFKNLPQIQRLVTTIKRSSPDAAVFVSHNRESFTIDPSDFAGLSNVHIMHVANINRADFSMMQAYLDGLAQIRARRIEFDWLVNMSGQCYPTRSLPEFETMLANAAYDGFMDYYEAFVPSERNPWDWREASGRYNYQYRWRLSTSELPNAVRKGLAIPRRVLNNIQPFLRIDTSYGFQIGTRHWPSLFGEHFRLYGGSFFKTLSRRAADYLGEFSQQRRDITDYFRNTSIPDEAFPQTVLLNNPDLSFSSDSLYYINWQGARLGRPRNLTVHDYDAIVARNTFFARKFEPAEDSRILDLLDERICGVASQPYPLPAVA